MATATIRIINPPRETTTMSFGRVHLQIHRLEGLEVPMIVSMSRFGTALSTRASGREAYDIVRVESRGFNQFMEFDFIGVSMVTNSFADELFGRMVMHLGMERMRALTTFRNVSPFWARIIRRAMDAHDSRKKLTKV